MPRASSTDILGGSSRQLRALLALAVDNRGEYSALLERARQLDDVERLLGEALGGADAAQKMLANLADPRTPLVVLRETREAAKTLIERATTNPHREAAALVYHAATAVALGRHGLNLSSVSPQSRLPLYEDLATALAAHPLADVFREAVDYMQAADGM